MKKLKKGAKGGEVRALQLALNPSSKPKLKIDGIFGDKTEAAVKTYQKNCKLKADGIAGDKTLTALGLGKGGDANKSGWPYADSDALVTSTVKQYQTVRERAEKALDEANKTKTGDMEALKKALLAGLKSLNTAFRAQQEPCRALVDMELAYLDAQRKAPKSVAGLLQKAKKLKQAETKRRAEFETTCKTLNAVSGQVDAAKFNAQQYQKLDTTTHRTILKKQRERKDQQNAILRSMKYCANQSHQDFANIRLRYMKLEASIDKAFKAWWAQADILKNLEEMYNKAITTQVSSELDKLKARIAKQVAKVQGLEKPLQTLNSKVEETHKELLARAKTAA